MTRTNRWTPNGNLISVQDEMHRLLHDLVSSGDAREPAPAGWIPPVDVHETATDYTLQFDLPGVEPKNVRIETVDGRLTIRGARTREEAVDGTVAHRLERAAGPFERSFRLKGKVDQDAIQATYKDGVLKIEVPKAPEAVKRENAIELG
jgi:HSP20 family protein